MEVQWLDVLRPLTPLVRFCVSRGAPLDSGSKCKVGEIANRRAPWRRADFDSICVHVKEAHSRHCFRRNNAHCIMHLKALNIHDVLGTNYKFFSVTCVCVCNAPGRIACNMRNNAVLNCRKREISRERHLSTYRHSSEISGMVAREDKTGNMKENKQPPQ